jgi:cytochrome P450
MVGTRSIVDLPGPPGLPLLGNAHQLRGERPHVTIERWCERYGPIFRFSIGPREIVAIADLPAINQILRERPEGFRRWRERQRIFYEMGIRAVFPAEGDDWRRQRRLAVTALSSHQLQRYFHIIATATGRLYDRVRKAARLGCSLEISRELRSFTIDITSALAFGEELNTLERGEEELQDHIQRVFQAMTRRTFAPLPYWRWVRLPADRALERSLAVLHATIAGFVANARERMSRCPELCRAPENFLQSMLAAQRDERSFSDEEIAGNALCFLIAGEDTTAHTIAWTVWFLAGRPHIQQRLAREADELLGEQRLAADYDTVRRLPYCEAVLRESMRLKPIIPAGNLEPIADTTIVDTRIPAGTRLWLLTRHAGLHASGISHAHDFDPERWLSATVGRGGRHDSTPARDSFLAFGAGARFCPGRNLAFLESQAALAMLARNFELELDHTDGPVRELFSGTVLPLGLRVRPRTRIGVDRGTPVIRTTGPCV